MATTNISIRMDKEIKERADIVFNDLGMNITTAFNIFVRQTLRQGKIPFEIYADPFFCESNMAVLQKSIKELNEEKTITKTTDDLLAMED